MNTTPSNMIPVSLREQQERRHNGLHRQARKWKARALAAELARDAAEQSAIAVHTASLTLISEMAKMPQEAPKRMTSYTVPTVGATALGKIVADGLMGVLEPENITINGPHKCEISDELRRELQDAYTVAKQKPELLARIAAMRDERDQAVNDLGALRHDLETTQRMMGENAEADTRANDELRKQRNALAAVLDSMGISAVEILPTGDLIARTKRGDQFEMRGPDAAASTLTEPKDHRKTVTIHFGHPNTPAINQARADGAAILSDFADQWTASARPAVHAAGSQEGNTAATLRMERDAAAAKLVQTEAALERLHTSCAAAVEDLEAARRDLTRMTDHRDRALRSLDATAHAHGVMVAERDSLQVERDAMTTRVRELEDENASLTEHVAGQRDQVHMQDRTVGGLQRELDGLRATNHDNAQNAVDLKHQLENRDELLNDAKQDLRIQGELIEGLRDQLAVKAGSERALVNALDYIRDMNEAREQSPAATDDPLDGQTTIKNGAIAIQHRCNSLREIPNVPRRVINEIWTEADKIWVAASNLPTE